MNLPVVRRRDTWDPFKDLWNFQDETERMFVPFDSGRLSRLSDGGGMWMMPVEVYETKERLVVKAELPGLESKDINVSMLGHTLTIRGERQHEAEAKEENFYRRELAYGVFQRQIELPQAVNPEGLKASYKNGILEISLPKREEAKPKQIKVDVQ